jgi:hypothetical protein
MEFDPTTRKLDDAHTTQGGSMDLDFEEQVAERRERNGRYGRDASREEAIAELTNENAPGFALWEERAPVQPRERQDSGVPVLDDF